MAESMSPSHPAPPFLFDDRHAGETVFVVGAGPQLATVRDRALERLHAVTTIAVNKVFFRFRPTYFLSAYVGEVLLAARRTPGSTLLHMRPVLEPSLVPGTIPLKREVFEHGMDLPRRLDPVSPTLLTRFNVALGATHLAYVLGARRIVFVGVEQRNQLHFWNFDEETRLDIRAALVDRGDPDLLRVDHPYASLAHDLAAVDRSPDDCMQPFYAVDHTPTFRAYFDILARNGVDVVATTAESVVADAGARVVCLDDVLAECGNAQPPAARHAAAADCVEAP
jgi:hypothetical protein